jgi:hypothetical protein
MRRKRSIVLVLAVSVLVVAGAGLFFARVAGGGNHSTTETSVIKLPSGCEKPANGYLIIASNEGFNDSVLHGAPAKSWPIITVKEGSTVNIVVCNVDTFAHGFQIAHYFDSNVETVGPGEVVKVSFVANEAGDFDMYCSIFCEVHIFMQNARLIVVS